MAIKISENEKCRIVLAGATGNLGGRIAKVLIRQGAPVHALVRRGTAAEKISELKILGVQIHEVDFNNENELITACLHATCLISALSGLKTVVFDAQAQLLAAAVKAGVRKFIPSDYSIDFTKIPKGMNRNLDVRREFQAQLDTAQISATSILNGAFADMLTGQAPIILFKLKRVLYWSNSVQKMDFTTIEDTAHYTALAALDNNSPRFLRIAGDQISARELAQVLSQLTGSRYKLLNAGGLNVLSALIRVVRKISPDSQELYPPWQGMQYLHNMYSGVAKFTSIDNDRYMKMEWTSTRDVLATWLKRGGGRIEK